jgi:hypothetical protein
MEKVISDSHDVSVAKSKEMETIKPFQLVKYLSVVGLCVVLIGAFVFSSFIARGAKKIVLRKSEENATLLAKNLNYRVVKEFIIDALATEGEIRLSKRQQYEKLDAIIRSTIYVFPVKEVNIYDLKGVLTYSTSKDAPLGVKKLSGVRFRGHSMARLCQFLKVIDLFLGLNGHGGIKSAPL